MITLKIKALMNIVFIVFSFLIYVPFPIEAAENQPAETLLQQLIQVDKELNTVFKEVLNRFDKKGKEALQKEQLAWIRERDKKCGTAFKGKNIEGLLQNAAAKEEHGRCVLEEDNKRRGQLKKKNIVKPSELAITSTLKFPPYPDIWDWHKYKVESQFLPKEGMLKMPNGDILIPYRIDNIAQAITFFDRKLFYGKDADIIINNLVVLLQKDNPEKIDQSIMINDISNDKTLEIKSITSHDLNCYLGPNRNPYKLVDLISKEETIFTIFKVLVKPNQFYVDGRYIDIDKPSERENDNATCQSQIKTIVTYKVESVTGQFMFLNDNTFLFRADATGEVMRFDKDLTSKSDLINNVFFIVKNTGSPYLMEELIGDAGYNIGPQEEANQLYKYLMNRRGK